MPESDFPPKKPSVKVQIPGPEAKAVVDRDTNALMTSTKTAPIVAKRAQGVWVEDVDGNHLLDFTSGIGVMNTGYSHPKVVEAIREQAGKLIHFAGTDFYYDEQVTLGERLREIVPGDFEKKVFFTNSGTESIEGCMKLARYQDPDRPMYLAFYAAFHGRTFGSMSLSSSKLVQRRAFFPTTPGAQHAIFPNPYRNPFGIDGYDQPEELVNRCIDFIEETLFQYTLPPDRVSAVFAEPVQGEGGYIVPPKQWFPALRKLCDEHGILMVADEVQSGFGRTGKMFAMEHFGVSADIVALAKGIASGMPMGAFVARADLNFEESGAHSNTYGGNALACAAALATIDVVQNGLIENAAKVGAHMNDRLKELKEKHDAIGDVRGLGLMQATEFVQDRATRKPDPKFRNRVAEEAMKRGLVLLPCGKSTMRYIPPLVATVEEVDAGLDVLDESIAAAGR